MKKTLPTLFEQFKASPKMPGLARGSGLAESDRIACHFLFFLLIAAIWIVQL